MSHSIYIYLANTLQEAELLLQGHVEEFEALLGDSFSDEELNSHAELIEQLASVECQPMLADLSFDDFSFDPKNEAAQRAFFQRCKSSICLENVPYIENNPFQVTYLIDLLWMFDDALIDLGGMSELLSKQDWLHELKKLRSMESLITQSEPKKSELSFTQSDPLDILVGEVYGEIHRLKEKEFSMEDMALRRQGLLKLMQSEIYSSQVLQKKSGLGLKDFGDTLEGLKFYLKKIN